MKKTRFKEEQIIGILRESESGLEIRELCRKHNMSEQTVKIAQLLGVTDKTAKKAVSKASL